MTSQLHKDFQMIKDTKGRRGIYSSISIRTEETVDTYERALQTSALITNKITYNYLPYPFVFSLYKLHITNQTNYSNCLPQPIYLSLLLYIYFEILSLRKSTLIMEVRMYFLINAYIFFTWDFYETMMC